MAKNIYEKMTQEDFDKSLCHVLSDMSANDIKTIPGVYEILSEHFNNDVLEDWKEENMKDCPKCEGYGEYPAHFPGGDFVKCEHCGGSGQTFQGK